MDYQMYKNQFDIRNELKKSAKCDFRADSLLPDMNADVNSGCADYDDDKEQLFEFITKMNEQHNKNIGGLR